jgi:rhamnosyl/mannosyltransferase
MHAVLERADVIVASSSEYIASSPILTRFREKVQVIPLGIDLPAEPAASPEERGRTGPRFFFLGRLVPYKGLPVLVEAFREVPGTLWIGGTGPLEPPVKARAAQAGLNGRVEFLGEVSDQERLRRFAACDAFVLPSVSRAEAFGLVLLEAMAMGRPVVVSDLPTGVRMLVEDGVTGYRFPPGDSKALAAALRRLAEDPAKARQMGAEGRRRVRQRWTTELMVSGYLKLYNRLCGGREEMRE